MLKIIREDLKNPDSEFINYPIMNREHEKDLSEYILSTFQSISYALPEIQLVDHKFIMETDKVEVGSYERTRSDKIKDKKKKYTYIQKSQLGELHMKFHADIPWEPENTIIPMDFMVRLLVPIPDEDGYMLVKGKRYILQYQLTEASTYTTSVANVLKSLLPIAMKRDSVNVTFTNGQTMTFMFYKTEVFNKYENHLFFYFATMGFSNTLEYFQVGEYIIQVDTPGEEGDGYAYVKIGNNLYLKVKEEHIQNQYIQSMIGGIVDCCSSRMSVEDLENKDLWTEKIGAFRSAAKKSSHHELGKRFIILFNRMLDKNTNDPLRLRSYNKGSVYKIIRWMVQNYNGIKNKNNLDILNKRLRCGELMGQLLNDILSEKIKSFVNTSANTLEKQITKYKRFFTWRGTEVISKLHSSGLMRTDDNVNDNDLPSKFKVTSKGPNNIPIPANAGRGTGGDKTVSIQRRALHPSHLRRFDINFCSTSDPGLTNYLTLACKTDGLYFEGAQPEPEDFSYQFAKDMGKLNGKGIEVVDPAAYNDVVGTVDLFQLAHIVDDE